MSSRTFRIYEDSLQERFQACTKKVQIFAGGFANGKTANSVIKALQLAQDYPGSNGLIARATYPKLNDTIRKEFLKWCPDEWIKSFPMSANASNTCVLKNGSEINFRYIRQQGKNQQESTTSNQLSATYDWVVVDQIEDPEITHKDFLDLLGRLRGSTPYRGDDSNMPASGPRWLIVTANPTRNWFYKRVVRPLFLHRDGIYADDLYCDRDNEGKMVLDDTGAPVPLVGLFEGSTYENEDNLPADYIKTLESTYTGQMRDRFLLGKWAAYEGLVYSIFDEDMHCHSRELMVQYLNMLRLRGAEINWVESYDHGLQAPSCYLLGYTDPWGNVLVIDGFYRPEYPIEHAARDIKQLRRKYDVPVHGSMPQRILADPSLFKRGASSSKTVGITVSGLFRGEGISMRRANADIVNGIVKVQAHLLPRTNHIDPITGTSPAPLLFYATELSFVLDEITDYYWRIDPAGERSDMPMDRNDHAMDATKYLLTDRPMPAKIGKNVVQLIHPTHRWNERDVQHYKRSVRHG